MTKSRIHLLAFLSALVFVGCQSMPMSFVDMGKDAGSASAPVYLTDANALRYANEIASYLRKKSNGARITREMSNSAALTLATLAAPGTEVFGFSARTGSVLGLTGTGILEFQNIFNAKGRSEAARDGVRFIEEAIVEFLSFNQSPSASALTQNGVTLVQRTMASVHLVEKTLTGEIPAPEDMAKATEPMSSRGAETTAPGSLPINNIPADPKAAQARGAYGALREPRPPTVVDKAEIPAPPPPDSEQLLIDFTKELRALRRDGSKTDQQRAAIYRATLDEAGYPEAEPSDSQLLDLFMDADTAKRRTILEKFRAHAS